MDLFDFQFMRYALIAGTAVAIAGAMLGNFIVAARQSLASDILAHAALAGVGVGIVLGVTPTIMASVVTLLAAGILWYLVRDGRRTPESVGMMILTGGLAIALLLAHVAKDEPVSFDTFLFGSILTITGTEVLVSLIGSMVILAVLVIFWHQLVAVVFDPHFARTQLRGAIAYELLFMGLVGIVVALALKVIGGLLIGALFVIPVLTAQTFTRSFAHTMAWSVVFAVLGIWSGVIGSFFLDIPASSGIVLALIALFSGVSVWRRIFD